MCGFAGILKLSDERASVEDLRRMSAAIQHRGPDEAGYALLDDGRVGFGHVRLSIIDLSHGQQPMYSADGTICIAFNGEIYDHAELRRELEAEGKVFRTTSDTEVIIALYQRYGLDFFSRLNGEFAFLLWDGRQRRLIAVRDRVGIKPLHWWRSGSEILFASEAKAILALPRVPRRLARDYLTGPLFGVFPPTVTAFEGVWNVKPGHCLILDPGKPPREYEYWRPRYAPDPSMTFTDAKSEVRRVLTRAVKRRMVADVDVGAYLSGGLDSTLVCATMAAEGQGFKAFNIGFGGSEYDESSLARKIALHYGVRFETINCSMDLMAENYLETIDHVELALVNPSAIAKQLLSGLVRSRGHKVCLTGEGSDENFGGYAYFKQERLWRMLSAGGEEARRGRALWKDFCAQERRSEGSLWDRSGNWKRMEHELGFPSFPLVRAEVASRWMPRVLDLKALGLSPTENSPTAQLRRIFDFDELRGMDPFNVTRRITLNQLAGYIIPTLGDRVEMANSVECRTPFLDRDLLELTGRIPPHYFVDIDRLREKHLLREAFRDVLPPFMETERKHPFMSPNWYRFSKTPAGAELVHELLDSAAIRKAGIFRTDFLKLYKTLWHALPNQTAMHKRVDIMMGEMLGVQALQKLFVDRPIVAPVHGFEMVERRAVLSDPLRLPGSEVPHPLRSVPLVPIAPAPDQLGL